GLPVDRLRSLYARHQGGRAPARRPLVVGELRKQGVRATPREGVAQGRASCAPAPTAYLSESASNLARHCSEQKRYVRPSKRTAPHDSASSILIPHTGSIASAVMCPSAVTKT